MENTDLKKMLTDIRDAIQFMNKTGDVSTASKDVLTAAIDDAILVEQTTPKLVLPERMEIDHDEPIYYQKKAMIWNDCIYTIKLLNPHITFSGYKAPK